MIRVTEEIREVLHDRVADALRGTYWCDRVWSAWQIGTMSEGDFSPAGEDGNIVDGVIDAVLQQLAPAAEPIAAEQALRKLCDQLDGMKRTMFLRPGTGQNYSYLVHEDVQAYVEKARAALAKPAGIWLADRASTEPDNGGPLVDGTAYFERFPGAVELGVIADLLTDAGHSDYAETIHQLDAQLSQFGNGEDAIELAKACGATTDWNSQPRNDPELANDDVVFSRDQLAKFAAALAQPASTPAKLTPAEQAFVDLVRERPGHKLDYGLSHDAAGNSLWKRPEQLGLIECVGSYKWVVHGAKPQNLVADAVRAANGDDA